MPAPSDKPGSTALPDRILVVDDDDAVRDVLAKVLRDAAYRVSCVTDGEAGWDALCSHNYDLLITDHVMPRLTGLDLLRRVRDCSFPVPVILISGKMPGTEPEILRLIEPGLALEKPFSPGEFLAAVRRFLNPSQSAGETCAG